MSEIEKLYENAGVRYIIGTKCKAKKGAGCKSRCPDCDYNTKPKEYPPFTAKKQLEIIKFVAKTEWIDNISSIVYRPLEDEWGIFVDSLTELSSETPQIYGFTRKTFEEALAKLVNDLWQDLSDTEKAEIKRILE